MPSFICKCVTEIIIVEKKLIEDTNRQQIDIEKIVSRLAFIYLVNFFAEGKMSCLFLYIVFPGPHTLSCIFFSFECPKSNFDQLLRGQFHSPDVHHFRQFWFDPRATRSLKTSIYLDTYNFYSVTHLFLKETSINLVSKLASFVFWGKIKNI